MARIGRGARAAAARRAERRNDAAVPPHPWWRPNALGWWIAALFMVGMVFGGNEVVAVAVAEEAGSTGMSSVILGAFALGSALSAVVFGTRTFSGPIARRFAWCALAMFLLEAPVLLLDNLWALTVMMFVAGSATAPTLITGITLVQHLVPRAFLTEGMAVAITALQFEMCAPR